MEIQAISETVRPSGGKGIEEEKTESLEVLAQEYLEAQKSMVTASGYKSLYDRTLLVLRQWEELELDPQTLGIREACSYGAWLGERYANAGTHLNMIKAAQRFVGYLVATERRGNNPFLDVRRPRKPEHISKNVLTVAQMGRLLDYLGRFHQAQGQYKPLRLYRLHVLAEFLYSTGLRASEAGSLKVENLDVEKRLVWVAHGKGEEPRMAYLTSYAAGVMKHYLDQGRAAVLDLAKSVRKGQKMLFGYHGCGIVNCLNSGLLQVCRELELPPITSHGFRHSLGTHLLQTGCDIRHIQVILGHNNINSTQVYTQVDKEDLKRCLDEFHPRRWAK